MKLHGVHFPEGEKMLTFLEFCNSLQTFFYGRHHDVLDET